MTTLIASNGEEIVTFVTPAGVEGFIPTSVPLGALAVLQAKLEKKLGLSPDQSSTTSTNQ